MQQELTDYKLESHTAFGTGAEAPEVKIQLQDKTGDWHAIKINRDNHRVVIDYVVNPDTELNPGVSNSLSATYGEAADAIRPRIENTGNVLPDEIQRTALRLIQLGWYLEDTPTDKYELPRAYGINPLRPSTQRYVIANVSGQAGRHTGPVIIGFDSPVPSPNDIEGRIKTQIAGVWASHLTPERRHAHGIESNEDLRDYVTIDQVTSTDSIDDARQIRQAMRDDEYPLVEESDGDKMRKSRGPSKQATLPGF